MLIECFIKREGPTHVTLGKFDYVFKKDEAGRKVCNVLSGGHQKHLLSINGYREVDPIEKKEPQKKSSKTGKKVSK